MSLVVDASENPPELMNSLFKIKQTLYHQLKDISINALKQNKTLC